MGAILAHGSNTWVQYMHMGPIHGCMMGINNSVASRFKNDFPSTVILTCVRLFCISAHVKLQGTSKRIIRPCKGNF